VASLDEETTLVLADIPGLIEGAHRGVGLGHDFLRHIQRKRVLIHMLDGMAEDPVLDFVQINSELALFDPELARKPQIVAFNKMDLPDVQNRWAEVNQRLTKEIERLAGQVQTDPQPFAISAATGQQVRPLLYRAAQLLEQAPPPAEPASLPVYRFEADPKAFHVSRDAQGWHVTGPAIERAAKMTYWEHYQSVRRFQRILETLGIDQALRQAGVQNGDTVFIGEFELEWQD
jgi:GTP-binding protein